MPCPSLSVKDKRDAVSAFLDLPQVPLPSDFNVPQGAGNSPKTPSSFGLPDEPLNEDESIASSDCYVNGVSAEDECLLEP